MLAAFGLAATSLVGLSLGLIGGGGSILTVPILVYLFGIGASKATGYSLFLVGATSLIGGLVYWRRGLVDGKVTAVFAVPSFLAVYAVRRFIMPAIAAKIPLLFGYSVTRDKALLILFAVLMIRAAWAMIRKRTKPEQQSKQEPKMTALFLQAIIVGILAGLLGAGGGFLIIPALVLFGGLPMTRAIGTSLCIIAIQSLFGFIGVVQSSPSIEWHFLTVLIAIATFGMLLGLWAAKYLNGSQLKAGFGWFVMIIGVVILTAEVIP